MIYHCEPLSTMGNPGIQDEYRNQLLPSLLYAEQLPLCERLEPLEADPMGQPTIQVVICNSLLLGFNGV
jgi:hypothetical protein